MSYIIIQNTMKTTLTRNERIVEFALRGIIAVIAAIATVITMLSFRR